MKDMYMTRSGLVASIQKISADGSEFLVARLEGEEGVRIYRREPTSDHRSKMEYFPLAFFWVIGLVLLVLGCRDLVDIMPSSVNSATAATSFEAELYGTVLHHILSGPICFIGGVGSVILGSIAAIRSQVFISVPAILGGAFLFKAEEIVSSLGLPYGESFGSEWQFAPTVLNVSMLMFGCLFLLTACRASIREFNIREARTNADKTYSWNWAETDVTLKEILGGL